MFTAKDLTKKKFGKLTVIERVENKVTKSGSSFVQWRCECECGKEAFVTTNALTSGNTKSCGCLQYGDRGKPVDYTGKIIGKIKVLRKDTANSDSRSHRWICKCLVCGMENSILQNNLRGGHYNKGCGWCKVFSFYNNNPIMQITNNNIYGTITITADNEYELSFLGEVIGKFKSEKEAFAIRRILELQLLKQPKDKYNKIMQEYHNSQKKI